MPDTQILQVHPGQPEPQLIAQAARLIQHGGLVAFPTETVYGLGASALDAQAIERIFTAKGRPATDPLIAHIAHAGQLPDLARDIPQLAIELGKIFWPGPLTLVLKRNPRVPPNLSADRDSVAVRQPAHPVAAALIHAAGVPIAAPSANLFSHPSPTTAGHVFHDLAGRIDLILDGGPTPLGLESTVLDLTADFPTVLRPGGLPVERLRELIPTLIVTQRLLAANESAASPGQLLKHYSPAAQVLLFTGPGDLVCQHMRHTTWGLFDSGKTLGVLIPDEDADYFTNLPVQVYRLGPLADLAAIARNLFTGLRALDSNHVDCILTRDLGRDGLGLAIWDRLFRAAEGKVIHVSAPSSRQVGETGGAG